MQRNARKTVHAGLLLGVLALSGCAGLVNPVPIGGQHRTAQQKHAQKRESGAEKFFSEVI